MTITFRESKSDRNKIDCLCNECRNRKAKNLIAVKF